MYKEKRNVDKIAIFGPHDRFNYGDFLFPIVIDYCFSLFMNEDVKLKKFSIKSSDFTKLGGFESKSYKDLLFEFKRKKCNVIIISGGECLAATWAILFSYLSPIYLKFFKYYRNNKIFRNIPKFLLGGRSEYPFSINLNDFNSNTMVFYNAVGGGWDINNIIASRLLKAKLIGVRDEKSYLNLVSKNISTLLVPDSAVMLSEIYKYDDLVFCSKLKGIKYIYFQVSNYLIKDNEIISVCNYLKKESLKHDFIIVFCPIGIASGHEDHIPLLKMHNLIKERSILVENPSIKEIASYIANAELYIGSSLHGVITAMNYGIPYIGLEKVIKQKEYIKTWSISELRESYIDFNYIEKIDIEKIFNLKLNERILEKNIINQGEYMKFIRKIFDYASSDNTYL